MFVILFLSFIFKSVSFKTCINLSSMISLYPTKKSQFKFNILKSFRHINIHDFFPPGHILFCLIIMIIDEFVITGPFIAYCMSFVFFNNWSLNTLMMFKFCSYNYYGSCFLSNHTASFFSNLVFSFFDIYMCVCYFTNSYLQTNGALIGSDNQKIKKLMFNKKLNRECINGSQMMPLFVYHIKL